MGGHQGQETGAQPTCSPKESDRQNRSHRSSYYSNSTQRHFFPRATTRSTAGEQQQLLRQALCSAHNVDAHPKTVAGCGAHAGVTALARHQASNASCTLGAVECCQDPNTRTEDGIPASISPDNFSATAQRSASACGTVLRVPAHRQDGSCPQSLAQRSISGVKRASSDVSEPYSNSKKPRSLHLHGDDTDDGKLLQLRGAISTQHLKADTDCNTSPQRHPTCWRQADAGMDLEAEGLDCLEDSLIGNDVVLAECKRHSQNLHAALQPVMFKDRSGHECVALESPSQLQACCSSASLTSSSVVRMVGSHCQMLKPYQVAALAYFAALMQRSIRSCVLALDVGLGGHSVISVWCAMLKCSNTKPLAPVLRTGRPTTPHMLALVVSPPGNLQQWRNALRRWAPNLTVAVLDCSSGARATCTQLEQHCALLNSGSESAAAGPGPFDVVLLSSAAMDAPTVRLLHKCPWLLAVIDGGSTVPRQRFKQCRQVTAGAQHRIALEQGPVDVNNSAALRNLLELVHSKVMDCRQGNMLSLAPCVSAAAEKRELQSMREALAPCLLHMPVSSVVHQWAPKQYVQRSSKMTEEHATVYKENAAQHIPLVHGLAPRSSPKQLCRILGASSQASPEDRHMSAAFKALYQVAQHPLLSTQHTPEVPPVRTACASSCSEYGPSERDDSCSLAPVDRNIMGGASLAELQPEEVLQASKCGSLLHLLRSSGPAVVASSFPAVLDIVGMLLAHSGIPSARLDAKSRLDDCMNVSSAFAAGKAQVVLVQQQVALKYPMLDLSRAELCIFYDSGLSRSAEKAVEACCLRVDKLVVTTFCRLVTADSIDESVAELQRRRQHHKMHSSSTSSNVSSSSGSQCCSGQSVEYSELLKGAVRADVLRHCMPGKGVNMVTSR